MVGRNNVRKYRPAPPDTRPRYVQPAVDGYRPDPTHTTTTPTGNSPPNTAHPRLIYLDSDRAQICIERLAATDHGREALAKSVLVPTTGLVGDYNAALLLSDVATRTADAALDLGDGQPLHLAEDLHPGQVVAVRGTIKATSDVLPSSMLITTDTGDVRVLVDRAQGLHLNQQYLTGRTLCTVGLVQSVSRRQIRAAAICTT